MGCLGCDDPIVKGQHWIELHNPELAMMWGNKLHFDCYHFPTVLVVRRHRDSFGRETCYCKKFVGNEFDVPKNSIV